MENPTIELWIEICKLDKNPPKLVIGTEPRQFHVPNEQSKNNAEEVTNNDYWMPFPFLQDSPDKHDDFDVEIFSGDLRMRI